MSDTPAAPATPYDCPMCGSPDTRVEEDVSDEVTVFACNECGSTWADRND